jgi:hypothetical protein
MNDFFGANEIPIGAKSNASYRRGNLVQTVINMSNITHVDKTTSYLSVYYYL